MSEAGSPRATIQVAPHSDSATPATTARPSRSRSTSHEMSRMNTGVVALSSEAVVAVVEASPR